MTATRTLSWNELGPAFLFAVLSMSFLIYAAVEQDWLRSHQQGITAVPTFRLNGETLVRAQPYEQLVTLLTAQGVPARKASEAQ